MYNPINRFSASVSACTSHVQRKSNHIRFHRYFNECNIPYVC